MIAAGKKNRLKMKYPMKLWPFRPATPTPLLLSPGGGGQMERSRLAQ